MGRGTGRAFLAIAQGLGDWRRERAATAEQARLEQREDDWRNSQIEREDARYLEGLKREPGVEVLEPTVTRTVDLAPPTSLPQITLDAPAKPTALQRAANAVAPSSLPKPDFATSFDVQDRNPAIEGKIALRPDENIYYDPKWQENKTRAERTALRDAAIAAGADPKNAELLLTNPTLIDNILPKPKKGWTVMGHEYDTEAEAIAAENRRNPPSGADVDRERKRTLERAEGHAFAHARKEIGRGVDPIALQDSMTDDIKRLYGLGFGDAAGIAERAIARIQRENLAATNTQSAIDKRKSGSGLTADAILASLASDKPKGNPLPAPSRTASAQQPPTVAPSAREPQGKPVNPRLQQLQQTRAKIEADAELTPDERRDLLSRVDAQIQRMQGQ
jgi:hypothetical protein